MAFKLNETGEVIEERIIRTETQEAKNVSYIGKLLQCNFIAENDTTRLYGWQRFDLEQGKYLDATEITDEIIIDGQAYTPINGRVEVLKPRQINLDADIPELQKQLKATQEALDFILMNM